MIYCFLFLNHSVFGEYALVNVSESSMLPNSCVGGKTGKSYFAVHVGDLQILYKTIRSNKALTSQKDVCGTPVLDVHGCIREDAIVKLDNSL